MVVWGGSGSGSCCEQVGVQKTLVSTGDGRDISRPLASVGQHASAEIVSKHEQARRIDCCLDVMASISTAMASSSPDSLHPSFPNVPFYHSGTHTSMAWLEVAGN